MRAEVNVLLVFLALVSFPRAGWADASEAAGLYRWVPSLAITSGVTMQEQTGAQTAVAFPTNQPNNPNVVSPLRPYTVGDDRVVSPYVGGQLEIMTPALSFPTFPRFFATAEVIPTFAPERSLATEKQPSRVRGPDVGAVLAVEEDSSHFTTPPGKVGARTTAFGENEANGQGMLTRAQIEDLVYGAKAGIAFAFEFRNRQMRIKPSVGWIHYKVQVRNYMVDATCKPSTICTNVYQDSTGQAIRFAGFLRESILQGTEADDFDGVGPGLDLEMDAGRFGPLGISLFAGVHAYYIPGDRDIFFGEQRSFDDAIGQTTHQAASLVRVAPWLYRGGLGIRFAWLGGGD
jgi:hypothetical protein